MNLEKEKEVTPVELQQIIDRLEHLPRQFKCIKWILKNIKKSCFFDILSLENTRLLLRELIIFRRGSFYLRLKKLLISWNNYIEQCNELRGDHIDNQEKKLYDSGLFVIPYNIVRRPFIIIHNGYCVYEQQRIVTTCSFTRFTDYVVTARKIKYQNACYYCNCRYTRSHNASTNHINNLNLFFSMLHDIQPLPLELWQYIVHFLY